MPGQRHEPPVELEASDIDIGNVDVTSLVYRTNTIVHARIDVNLTGGSYGTLVGATASVKIYVVAYILTTNAQCELEFVDDPAGTPAPLTAGPTFYLSAYDKIGESDQPGYRFVTNAVNKALGIDEVANATVNIRGHLWYYKSA